MQQIYLQDGYSYLILDIENQLSSGWRSSFENALVFISQGRPMLGNWSETADKSLEELLDYIRSGSYAEIVKVINTPDEYEYW